VRSTEGRVISAFISFVSCIRVFYWALGYQIGRKAFDSGLLFRLQGTYCIEEDILSVLCI
jgi:hypothetical protein